MLSNREVASQHIKMLRIAARSARIVLKQPPSTRISFRYAYLIAASAVALSKSHADESNQHFEVETKKERVLNTRVKEVSSTLTQKARKYMEWLLKVLQALIRCGMLWLQFLPALITAPVLVTQSQALGSWWWGILRASICNAGPTFIKFSQWAAMRPDLFPNRVCDELSKLQSGAKKHSWAQTQAILKRVLGEKYEEVLQIREDSLVGSGCVAQVYRGKMILHKPAHDHNGRIPNHQDASADEVEVAVKVLHPGIRESMQLDLNLMSAVASALEWAGELTLRLFHTPTKPGEAAHAVDSTSSFEAYPLRCVSLSESVLTFATFMQSQLDLTQEAQALDRLNTNFSDAKWANRVLIPKTVRYGSDNNEKATSESTEDSVHVPHADVLVETYQAGESMIRYINSVNGAADAARKNGAAVDANQIALNKEIAALGLDAILKMLFEDNFVHADLHAGNVVVRRDGAHGHPQLILLDAGLVVELQPFDRKNFISLFRAVIDNDGREVARLMMEYSPRTKSITGDEATDAAFATVIRPDEYAAKMAELVSFVHAQGLSLKNISVSELLRNVLSLSYEHNVKLESRFVSVVVAIMLAEGMGRSLDPEIDIIARARPFVRSAAISMLLGK